MDKDEHYFFNQLQVIVNQLDELDELGKQCSVEQSKCDQEISDWLHRIQNEDLDDTEYIKIGKKIKEVRIKREHIYNVWELYKVYTNEKERLQDKGNRIFLMNTMRSRYNQFGKDYNNRVLTENDINETKKGRKKIDTLEVIRMFNEGKSVKEIAQELNCAAITIYKHLKKGD